MIMERGFPMSYRSIAIDGPSGAGKSTLAKRLAQELGFLYVDTGAIYRTVGLAVRRRGVAPSDAAGVEAILPDLVITMAYEEDGLQHMYLGGEDVTEAIRENEISVWVIGSGKRSGYNRLIRYGKKRGMRKWRRSGLGFTI